MDPWREGRRERSARLAGRFRESSVNSLEKRLTGLAIKLLGGMSVSANGEPVNAASRKDRCLLAFLALNGGQAISREKLANLLWADRADEQARGSLRQSLAALRSVFPLSADRETVRFSPDGASVDVLEFRRLSEFKVPGAITLYGGPLLDGIDPPTPEFAGWLMAERQKFERLAAELVENLAGNELEPKEAEAAIGLSRQLLDRDPVAEPLWRALMRLLVRQGRWIEALKVHGECRAALSRELGIEPSLETDQLYRAVMTAQKAEPPEAPGERPKLAVMPFQNIGRDPALDPLCEGLAEDIITGLGQFKLFPVIDRHSSQAVSQASSDAEEIGRRLGVDFVVQGSLQRQPEQLRITVRLVEAASRTQRWSGQFTFGEAEIVSAPGKIAAAILPSLNTQAEKSLIERSRRKPTLQAYEYFLIGVRHLRGYAPDDNRKAIENFDLALKADPKFALALAYRGFADIIYHGYDSTPQPIKEAARKTIQRAASLDPEEPRIWWLLGAAHDHDRDLAMEEICYRKSLALNPNEADAVMALGLVIVAKGEHERGLALCREAFRLNPYHPEWYWIDFGSALYVSGKFEEAIESYSHRHDPGVWVLCRLAVCHARLGRMDEAKALVDRVLKLKPDFKVSDQRSGGWTSFDTQLFREGMKIAGLPE